MSVNRNHLALFHQVARAGGISRGAQLAHVSQPAVSKQIQELEQALGIRLLERQARGSRLTQAGRILAEYAQRLATLEQDAERAIEELRGLKRGRLALGASTTVGAYLLPPALSAFHRAFPQVELKLEIANTREIEAALLDGSIEAAFTEGLGNTEHLQSEVFQKDELVVIAPPGHALLKKRRLRARDLAAEPFIFREEGSGTRAVVEQALAARSLQIKPLLALAATEAIKQAVVAGVGLAIVSRLAIASELKLGTLAEVPVAGLKIPRPLHLQRMRDREPSPALKCFLQLLQASRPRR